MNKLSEKFGSSYLKPIGYVVESEGLCDHKHKFGGNSWEIIDNQPISDGPVLLFVLDLSDPKLLPLDIVSLSELPICSYINSDVWLQEQVYKVNENTKEILLISKTSEKVITLDDKDRLPSPLPEKEIDLREMKSSEYPTDEDSYWRNTNEFLGGQSFFRVAGSPLWLQDAKNVQCSCCSDMTYVMSIGYEGWGGPFKYVEQMPFFLGEAALYVYFCDKCTELKVICQTS
jgi:hypothetical protein